MRHDQSRVAPRRHRTQRARPAKLVAEQFAERSLRTAVNHDERRYRDAHAEAAHGFTDGVVVGERIEERFESADGGERVASKRDRRTEARPCNAEREADQHVRQEVIVDRHAREPRPRAVPRVAAVQACHAADTGPVERSNRSCQIIALDRDVAVGDDDHRVPRVLLQSDERGDLRVRARYTRIDDQSRVAAGSLGNETVDDLDRCIGRILHAEQYLHRSGIVLIAE